MHVKQFAWIGQPGERERAKIHMSHPIYSPSRSQCASRSALRDHFFLILLSSRNPFWPSVSVSVSNSSSQHTTIIIIQHLDFIAISTFTSIESAMWHRYDLLTLSHRKSEFSARFETKRNETKNKNMMITITTLQAFHMSLHALMHQQTSEQATGRAVLYVQIYLTMPLCVPLLKSSMKSNICVCLCVFTILLGPKTYSKLHTI